MKRLALLGANGHGKVVADASLLCGWDEIDFFDDAWPQRQINSRWKVHGTTDSLISRISDYQGVIVSIGDCVIRWQKHQVLQKAGALMAIVVHPAAVVSKYTEIGEGSVILAGAVINIDVKIGSACVLNTGSTVDHDCRLANAVHVCPGAHVSGGVQIENCAWVGVGAAVKQGLMIGEYAVVGAGAVVVSSVPSNTTVVGNPAKFIESSKLANNQL